jgi:hypothetical protein
MADDKDAVKLLRERPRAMAVELGKIDTAAKPLGGIRGKGTATRRRRSRAQRARVDLARARIRIHLP